MSTSTSAGVGPVFATAKEEGRGVLVGYLPAGFPSHDGAIAAFEAMAEAGVDVFEVGLPYSDPTMDGPTIQAAADQALRGGTAHRGRPAYGRGGRPGSASRPW